MTAFAHPYVEVAMLCCGWVVLILSALGGFVYARGKEFWENFLFALMALAGAGGCFVAILEFVTQ